MSSTFDPTSYRSDLDRLSFSPDQKARMAQRLAETASGSAPEAGVRETGTGKILELHDAGSAHGAPARARRPKAHRGGARRIAAALGIATLLTIGGGTAYATGALARAADSLAAVFGVGPAQTELIDRIGRPIGASCTSNGITITADAITGMRHAYAVVYTIEKEDGTAFDELKMSESRRYNLFLEGSGNVNALTALRLGIKGGHGSSFTFDANPADNAIQLVESRRYNLFLEGSGNVNALTALRLGIKGGHGSSFTFDANPADNAIQLVEMMSLTGSNASLAGETLHFEASKLLYFPEGKQADGRDLPVETLATGDWSMSFKIDYDSLAGETLHFEASKLLYFPEGKQADGRDLPVETLATGDWSMSFKIDYEDLSVDLPTGQTFTINGSSAVINELAISPLGADVTYTVDALDGPSGPTGLETNSDDRAGHGDLTVTFADGTTQELGSGYGSWQEGGKTVVQKTWFFDRVRPVDDIASITVGDLTIPIK